MPHNPKNTYRFISSPAPHIHSGESHKRIIWSVCFALLPSGLAGVYIFGFAALKTIFASVTAAMITEWLIIRLLRRKPTLSDGSAFLTGLLLAYNLPPSLPFWMPAAGSVFAIAICKQAFGGLGCNIFNPALAGRAFLLASWPAAMTSFTGPLAYDAVTSATPLTALKASHAPFSSLGISYLDMFLGLRGGCIGEVCIIMLLLGASYLLWKGYIGWEIPISFIGVACGLSWIFSPNGFFAGDFLFSLFAGGLVLGAFFMATDYVTCPITRRGRFIFGFGCGLFTFLIRRFGGYPEGVSYAILIMNAFVPLIDRYAKPWGVRRLRG